MRQPRKTKKSTAIHEINQFKAPKYNGKREKSNATCLQGEVGVEFNVLDEVAGEGSGLVHLEVEELELNLVVPEVGGEGVALEAGGNHTDTGPHRQAHVDQSVRGQDPDHSGGRQSSHGLKTRDKYISPLILEEKKF